MTCEELEVKGGLYVVRVHKEHKKKNEDIELGTERSVPEEPDQEFGVEQAPPGDEETSTSSNVDDPFAVREGKSLTWSSVNMTVIGKKKMGKKQKTPDKKILDNVWGQVPARETTGILGPSGSGKTSLLNILSGRTTSDSQLCISADMRLNNYSVDPSDMQVRKQIAYVAQEDSLHIASTPRECIKFSAKLRLPRSMTDEQLDTITTRMLQELGLLECADTLVGGGLLKGISGGEKKRTSVGVELVTKPAMVFLDEPTSGLDSFSALQVCNVLKNVAKAGASVLFTIHQPASEIFDSFHHLILLNKGRVMYEGSVDAVPEYFEARGQPLPPKYNPADWIMIVAQTLSQETLEADGFFPEDERDLEPTPFSAQDSEGRDDLGISRKSDRFYRNGQHSSIKTQIAWMMGRELKSLYRDKMILGARLGLTSFMSILIGILFWQVGDTDSSDRTNLNSHFGAVLIVLVSSMFGTALPSLVGFAQDRPVFLREYSTDHYNVISYFLSRLVMEALVTAIQMTVLATVTYFMISLQLNFGWNWIIIFSLAMSSTAISVLVGCSVTDTKLAMEFLPLCFVPQFLFSGFFVAPELIPAWIRWLQWVMPLTYSTKLFLNQEFGVECSDPNCETLLSDLNVNSEDVWWYWLALAGLFVLFRSSALVALTRKASKFY